MSPWETVTIWDEGVFGSGEAQGGGGGGAWVVEREGRGVRATGPRTQIMARSMR